MPLSSLQLEAFAELAKTGSFSKAAKQLHITQSALSQRIANLETELCTGLIIRDPRGLRITAAGEELLRYCKTKEDLEHDLLDRIASSSQRQGGVIRIAGFSTIMRSVIMPAIQNVVRDDPSIRLELYNRELRELPKMLSSNEVDFMITTEKPVRQSITSHLLGYEVSILVERHGDGSIPDIYLDHDSEDSTTMQFLALNNWPKARIERHFLDEIYGIIDGVRLGWGRAVVPLHLIKDIKDVRTVAGYEPLRVPVFLQYYAQPYYSSLHQRVCETLCQTVPKHLAPFPLNGSN